jgi:hypothetical protein
VTTLPELVPGFEEKQAGVCGPTASRRPLSPHCRSQLLVALADSVRFSKRRRRSWKIYDRLLTIGSDRGQLASPANGWTTAFAQQRSSDPTRRDRPVATNAIVSSPAWRTTLGDIPIAAGQARRAAQRGLGARAAERRCIGRWGILHAGRRALLPARSASRLPSADDRFHDWTDCLRARPLRRRRP